MRIDDSGFPGPVLIPASAVTPGSVVRVGDNYVTLGNDGTWFDLTAGVVVPAPTGNVQPVTSVLTITAPA